VGAENQVAPLGATKQLLPGRHAGAAGAAEASARRPMKAVIDTIQLLKKWRLRKLINSWILVLIGILLLRRDSTFDP
jgi:hypothetical protein